MLYFPNIKPYYAIKCNPDPVILTIMADLGASFECASEPEIKQIIDITKDPSKIIFANPCKMSSHIKYAQLNNVNMMTFDCDDELYKIKKNHSKAKLIMRLTVDESNSVCKFNSKFGCDLDSVGYLIDKIISLKLNLVGFSFHVGSNCKSVDNYKNAIKTCRMAYNIAAAKGIYASVIDIGGGFPGVDSDIININSISKVVNAASIEYFGNEIQNGQIKFIAEPGRYFVEQSHTLILTVIGKKQCIINGENAFTYYLNDGLYGSFNCIYFDHRIPILETHESYYKIKSKDSKKILYNSKFFGPTCDSIDLIAYDIYMPELLTGDRLYIRNFGAYTSAAGSQFNGFNKTTTKYLMQSDILTL